MARKKKRSDDDDEQAAAPSGVRLSAHPRARRQIAATKGWAGLICFVVAAVLCYRADLPLGDTLLRGLVAGVAGYLAAWAIALAVWRQIALAQIEDLRRTLIAEMEERARRRAEELERQQAEQTALMEAEAARARAPEGALQN